MIRFALAVLLLIVPGCTHTTIKGDCIHMREIKTTYQCEGEGQMEHYGIQAPY